jgi:membrane fusion protein (multidrug efflux system)
MVVFPAVAPAMSSWPRSFGNCCGRLAACAVLGGLLAAGCSQHGSQKSVLDGAAADDPSGLSASSADGGPAERIVALRPESVSIPLLPAFKVEPQVWQATVRSQGGLIADELTVIGARMTGRIAEVAVDVGQQVNAGDVLVRLEEDELRLRAEQARAQLSRTRVALGLEPLSESLEVLNCPDEADLIDVNAAPEVARERARLEEARGQLARLEALISRNAVSRTDLEAGIAAVAVAEATLAAAMQQVEEKVALVKVHRAALALSLETLQQAVIRAPFDGVVQSRHGSAPGASVQLSDPLVTLVRTDPLRFRGTVPERQALKLRVGQQVLVRLDSVAKPIVSKVARIAPLLDEMSRTLMFEADIPNPEGCLRSGLFAQADVVVDEQAEALVVPMSSVREFAGREKVWRVEPSGQSRGVAVRTGRRSKGLVEIVSGLSPGDLVIQDAAAMAGVGFSH